MSAPVLLAYDENGDVVASLDRLYEAGQIVDLAGAEATGEKLRRFWVVSGAVGSGTWPENLGASAVDYRVVLDSESPHRIVALVHRQTGARRDRAAVEVLDDLGAPGRPVRPVDLE